MKEIFIFILLSSLSFLVIYMFTLLQGFDLHYLMLAFSYNKVGILKLDKVLICYFLIYFGVTLFVKLRQR
ncbi:hypothetical protein CN601_12035 [Bacillus sp. AFS017336]|nr:hypothetical protein CN601_12035 [Bacillus sp. AFS017336]